MKPSPKSLATIARPLAFVVVFSSAATCFSPARGAESSSSSPFSVVSLATPSRPVIYQPCGVAVNPATRRTYVANRGEDKLIVLDERNEIIARLPAPGGPSGVTVNQRQNAVFVTATEQNAVLVFDGESHVMRQIPVGKAPTSIVANAATGLVYVLNSGEKTLSVLDRQRLQATIALDEVAHDVAVNPALNRIYVTSYGSGTLKVIDGQNNQIIATVPTGMGASGVAVHPATNRVYVANAESNTLSVIDGAANKLLSSVPVGEYPNGVGVNFNSNQVYVASAASRTLTILDGEKAKVLSILDAGLSPSAIAVNSAMHRVYLVSSASNNVLCLKSLPNRAPDGSTVWQGQDVPLSRPTSGMPTVVSEEKRAGIDAALNTILGLSARKKSEDAQKLLAEMETQYGASLELALYQATFLMQNGDADKARALLQRWIPPSLTIQPTTPPSVIVPPQPPPQRATYVMPPNQPSLPNEATPDAGKIERLPLVEANVKNGVLPYLSGPESYLSMEKAMHDAVNATRRAAGLEEVVWEGHLADCARAHSAEMRDKNYLSSESPHAPLRTVSERYQAAFGQWNCAVNENVMRAKTGGKPLDLSHIASALQAFSQSPPHRAIMLDPRWKRSGVGFATDEKGGLWITQMFATTPR